MPIDEIFDNEDINSSVKMIVDTEIDEEYSVILEELGNSIPLHSIEEHIGDLSKYISQNKEYISNDDLQNIYEPMIFELYDMLEKKKEEDKNF